MLPAAFLVAPLLSVNSVEAQDSLSIAVADFKSNAPNCQWCNTVSTRTNLANLLSTELAALGIFEVLDRQNLQPVLDEQELAELGLVPTNAAPQRGNFASAKYLILGSINDYQEQAGRGQRNRRQCFLVVCRKSGRDVAEAYVTIELRVVDTETARIVHAYTVEGRSSSEVEREGTSLSISVFSSDEDETVASLVPTSQAVRAAMTEAVSYLSCVMVKQDTCLAEFEQRDEDAVERIREQLNLDESPVSEEDE